MLPGVMLSYSIRVDQYLNCKLMGNCLRVRCSIYAFSSATSRAVQEASSWCWRRGHQKIACLPYHQRAPQNFFKCKWFNTGALAKTKHGCYHMSFPLYPPLCLVSDSKSILPYSGKPFDFFSLYLGMWGEKRGKSLSVFVSQLLLLPKSSDRGKELKECELLATPLLWPTHTSPSPVLWLLGRHWMHCSVRLVARSHASTFTQVNYAGPKAVLWHPRRPKNNDASTI